MGDKLEEFYVTLRLASVAGPGEALYNVATALFELERHECKVELAETPEVLYEIVQDCRKKAAQVLRVAFAEQVRVLIAENSKRLLSKAALSLDAESTLNHAQRHANTLIDLLGTWSNILVSIDAMQVTGPCLRLLVTPLHLRVIEASQSCFTQFKADKRLDEWHRKLMAQDVFSVVALDALLSQMVAMREVASQYYSFLDSIRLLFAVDADAEAYAAANSNLCTLLSIVSPEERRQWRELDASYIALEIGYLEHTVKEALGQPELLEAEVGALVPQAVEDAFYLLHRVSERALGAGSESAALAVGNRIIELLDPAAADLGGAAIFLFVSDKRRFFGCHKQRRLSLPLSALAGGEAGATGSLLPPQPPPPSTRHPHQQQEQPSSSSSPSQTQGSDGRSLLSLPSSLSATALQERITSAVGVEIAEELSAGATVIADVASEVNSWLTKVGITGRRVADWAGAKDGGAGGGDALGAALQEQARCADGALSGVELLVAALETETVVEGSDDDDQGRGQRLALEFCMDLGDWGVYLSALAVAPASIGAVLRLYSQQVHRGASIEAASGLDIIGRELIRVQGCFSALLEGEAAGLLSSLFRRHLQQPLSAALSASYELDGAEMERRSGDSDIVRTIHAFAGTSSSTAATAAATASSASSSSTSAPQPGHSATSAGSWQATESFLGKNVKPHCTLAAYGTLLVELAKILSDTFVEAVVGHCRFSEWGALLLHEEALGMVRVLEEASEPTQRSTKDAFAPLLWALKLLSVNQLADLRHYAVPSAKACMDDAKAREILKRRVDFLPSEVASVKIRFTP
jgi:hypothetical protein